jgi:hypothetical protein
LPRRLGLSKRLCLSLFAGIAWALWKNRNKMAIEKHFPNSLDAVLHMIANFVKMWAELLKETDRAKTREMTQSLSDRMKMKACYTGPFTDIIVM